jgi:hypothetical protein
MTNEIDEERDPELADALHRREDVRKADRTKLILGAVAFVSVLAAAILATLFWANSQNNANRLAASNDAGIVQFEYCKKAPKTDPRCQQPVAQPAEKVVSGPQGVQGIQGIAGRDGAQGPQGIQGKQGVPGVTPPCLSTASRCQGSPGIPGIDGKPGLAGKDGANGVDGKNGLDGKNGTNGLDGKDGAPGVAGKDGKDGVDGKDGEPGPDTSAIKCTAAGGTWSTLTVLVPADPPDMTATRQISTCVIP